MKANMDIRAISCKRFVALAVALTVCVTTGCGSDDNGSAPPTTDPVTSLPPVPALIGTWTRETTCEEAVERQIEAGFADRALDSIPGQWLPDIESTAEIADPSHPCVGAVPSEHSHFFTEDGAFGSLDAQGEQVDDGTFEIVDDHTFVIPYVFDDEAIDIEFEYAVTGDSITFEPRLPADCTSDHCQEAASWAVSVAFAGLSWQRTG
jgi:hypothetical protein